MAKTDPLAVRLDPDVRDALDDAARAEERSLSWLVNRAAREWLKRNGYLKEPKR